MLDPRSDGLDANAIEADVLADTTEDLEFSNVRYKFFRR